MRRLLCSLLGLLCTQICWVKGQQVKQSPVTLVLQEGESTELQCNFSTSAKQMQWFYQSPGGHLISLFFNSSGTKQSGRLKSTTVTQERRSSLSISSSQTTDSGTYFCAVDPQCSPHTCSQHTNLQLELIEKLIEGLNQCQLGTKHCGNHDNQCKPLGESYGGELKRITLEMVTTNPWLSSGVPVDTQTEKNNRYSVTFKKSAKSISLVISSSQVEDSVKYFCALWEQTHSV
ncbi:T-cell receptor alpha chain V region 2B4 [Microtus ochrogaster]|nr:T-cell receptor alpha chain V region 2B4 [Microtus ochrogaster]